MVVEILVTIGLVMVAVIGLILNIAAILYDFVVQLALGAPGCAEFRQCIGTLSLCQDELVMCRDSLVS